MSYSNKTILNHIPGFLAYCRKKGLSHHTLENYSRYLKKFRKWMEYNKYENILPHDFRDSHAFAYTAYITSSNLSSTSQNYYLIALRALLSYFGAEDVISLVPQKISLNNSYKTPKSSKIISLDEIERFWTPPMSPAQMAYATK